MWLLWAVPAAIILLFTGIIGTKTTKRWAKRGRKSLARSVKKTTTQRWKKRRLAQQRITTRQASAKKVQQDRIKGRTPAKRPAPKPRGPVLCGAKNYSNGLPCHNSRTPGHDACHLHAGRSKHAAAKR